MSTRLDGGGRGGREFFLSTHRCPEVDLLPHHNSKTQIPAWRSVVPSERSSEFTGTGQSEANYLDVTSTCRSEEEEEEQGEEEGSISDWSEEDLSFHFSPSVILPSDDEESDTESGLECIDVTMETQVKDQKGEGPKMVPKRLIQLKKKKEAETIADQEKIEKLQVILKDGPAVRGGANSEVSANELLCPTVRRCPDLLLRQHSMPASFHTHSTTSSDVDSYRVYRGLVTGASQGPNVGDIVGNAAPRQRLQRSFSLDDTKTKMASCIITSVLSKKMQVEQNTCKTSYLQRNAALLPAPPQRVREAAGVSRAPVHVVRDVRSLVKNTYSLSFSSTAPDNKAASFKVIGQDDSPPPTYQQAVGHDETKARCPASSRGREVAASLSQSQDRQQSHPLAQQRRGSEPSRSQEDDVVLLDPPTNPPVSSDLSELSQSERGRDVSHQAGTSLQPPVSAQEQSPVLGVSSQSASQQILHPCFYAPTALPAFPSTLQPHLGQVSYLHSPLSYIQTRPVPILHWSTGNTSDQLDHVVRTGPPPWTRTAGDQESSGNTVAPATQQQHEQLQQQQVKLQQQLQQQHEQLQQQHEQLQQQHEQLQQQHEQLQQQHEQQTLQQQHEQLQQQHEQQMLQQQHEQLQQQHEQQMLQQQHEQLQQQHEQQTLQQQQFLCSIQGFLPAQVGSDFLADITGAAAAPGAVLSCSAPSGPAPCHMIFDPKSGRYFYVDTPPQHQRKLLLDPETGQFIKVLLPAPPHAGVLRARCANPAPISINPAPMTINPTPTPMTINHAPTVLSVVPFRPTVGVPSLYATPCLPFALHMPAANM